MVGTGAEGDWIEPDVAGPAPFPPFPVEVPPVGSAWAADETVKARIKAPASDASVRPVCIEVHPVSN